MHDGAKAWDNKQEIYVESGGLVGGRKGVDLPDWVCGKCAASKHGQQGVCCATKCKGKPDRDFMGQQAAKQETWRLEKTLTPGAAP